MYHHMCEHYFIDVRWFLLRWVSYSNPWEQMILFLFIYLLINNQNL